MARPLALLAAGLLLALAMPAMAQHTWRQYALPHSGFSVSTPLWPKIIPAGGRLGKRTVSTELLVCRTWTGRLVAYSTPLPATNESDATLQQRADSFAQEVIKSCNAHVVASRPESSHGLTGAVYMAESPDSGTRYHFFVAADSARIYVAAVQAIRRRDNQNIVSKFFQSLIPQAASFPSTAAGMPLQPSASPDLHAPKPARRTVIRRARARRWYRSRTIHGRYRRVRYRPGVRRGRYRRFHR